MNCLKIYYVPTSELRRVRLSSQESEDLVSHPFNTLATCIVHAFPFLDDEKLKSLSPSLRLSTSFVLHYEDDEGDVVTLSSDGDVREALFVMTALEKTSLKVTMSPRGMMNDVTSSSPRGQEDTARELMASQTSMHRTHLTLMWTVLDHVHLTSTHCPSDVAAGVRAMMSTSEAREAVMAVCLTPSFVPTVTAAIACLSDQHQGLRLACETLLVSGQLPMVWAMLEARHPCVQETVRSLVMTACPQDQELMRACLQEMTTTTTTTHEKQHAFLEHSSVDHDDVTLEVLDDASLPMANTCPRTALSEDLDPHTEVITLAEPQLPVETFEATTHDKEIGKECGVDVTVPAALSSETHVSQSVTMARTTPLASHVPTSCLAGVDTPTASTTSSSSSFSSSSDPTPTPNSNPVTLMLQLVTGMTHPDIRSLTSLQAVEVLLNFGLAGPEIRAMSLGHQIDTILTFAQCDAMTVATMTEEEEANSEPGNVKDTTSDMLTTHDRMKTSLDHMVTTVSSAIGTTSALLTQTFAPSSKSTGTGTGKSTSKSTGYATDNATSSVTSTEETDKMNTWFMQHHLNQYGDSKDTMYTGGSPLFNESTGESISFATYVSQRHPTFPWRPTSSHSLQQQPTPRPMDDLGIESLDLTCRCSPTVEQEKTSFTTHSPAPLAATFVSDGTLPDGTVVSPKTTLLKTWHVRNSGRAAWPLGCSLIPIEDDQKTTFMARTKVGVDPVPSPSVDISLTTVAPNTTTPITLRLVAPETPGRYIWSWRLVTSSGVTFGDDLFVDFLVVPANMAYVDACALIKAAATQDQFHKDTTTTMTSSSSTSNASASSLSSSPRPVVHVQPPFMIKRHEETKEELPYAMAREELRVMGFTQESHEVSSLLQQYDGDLAQVIHALLG